MQRNIRGGYVTSFGGGSNGANGYYSSPMSPMRLNSTSGYSTPQRSINSSLSFIKPTPDRSSTRSPIKQVRYDTRGPIEMDSNWHMRSASEHSYLNQNTIFAMTDYGNSASSYHSSASTLSPRHERPSEVTPTGIAREAPIQPASRSRISRPNAVNQSSNIATTAGNMYSQLSEMAQIQPRNSKNQTVNSSTLPRRDSRGTFQMFVDGVQQPGLSSDAETIKRRLLEDYQSNRIKEAVMKESSFSFKSHAHKTPLYLDELTSYYAQKPTASNTLGRRRADAKVTPSGTACIPLRDSKSNCMTRSEYNERIVDYRGNMTTARPRGEYSFSAMTSPTGVRGLARSTGQASPTSVIEELQGRFQNSERSRNKRPILKASTTNNKISNNTNGNGTVDYVSPPVYHRRTATAVTLSTTLASRPHHQSDLTLPTTTTATLESSVRTINTASTVRLDTNGTMRAGGPSFRRLQTLYGTNQKRYPSDNALDMTYLEEKNQQPQGQILPQFYVSGRKAGTVKIQVRSRSEQTSPTNDAVGSPRQAYRMTSGGAGGDDRIRSQHVILPQNAAAVNRPSNASSSVDGPQSEDDENQVLPSVREIIRQVEEMTLKNNNSAHNSTTTLHRTSGSSQHVSRSVARPVNSELFNGGTYNRSQSASSAHLNGYGRPANQNGGYQHANSTNSGDFNTDSYERGYSTMRRGDYESDNRRNPPNSLLEAFLEQRKEIQRLRKEMSDKDKLIASLKKDIHMYEPWR